MHEKLSITDSISNVCQKEKRKQVGHTGQLGLLKILISLSSVFSTAAFLK